MKEIIGSNLRGIFNKFGLDADPTYSGKIGIWAPFEVWKLSEDAFETVSNMSEEEWDALCKEISVDAWWRYADGANMGDVNAILTINGQKIVAWRDERRVEDLFDEYDDLDEDEKAEYDNASDYVKSCLTSEYRNLMDYFCDELGASQLKNICALAKDLAKYNGMGLGQLFAVYGGKNA